MRSSYQLSAVSSQLSARRHRLFSTEPCVDIFSKDRNAGSAGDLSADWLIAESCKLTA